MSKAGPVVGSAPIAVIPDNNNPPKNAGPAPRSSAVAFEANRLTVGKKRMLFRAIRYTDTMLPVLRNAGFNTICFDRNVNDALIKEAGELGATGRKAVFEKFTAEAMAIQMARIFAGFCRPKIPVANPKAKI